MRTSLTLWAGALVLALFTGLCSAQTNDNTKPGVPQSWWTKVAVSPYGTVQHRDFEGKPLWGAGVELRYQVNRTVSLGMRNSIFDYPAGKHEEGGWLNGKGIDETEVLFRGDLIRGGGPGRDRFSMFLIGSGGYNYNTDDFDLGVGPGVSIRFHKNVALEFDYRIRATVGGEEFGAATGALSLRF